MYPMRKAKLLNVKIDSRCSANVYIMCKKYRFIIKIIIARSVWMQEAAITVSTLRPDAF